MLILAGILFVLWILGLLGHVAAGFIHILLVLAVVLFIWHLVTGRRHTV